MGHGEAIARIERPAKDANKAVTQYTDRFCILIFCR